MVNSDDKAITPKRIFPENAGLKSDLDKINLSPIPETGHNTGTFKNSENPHVKDTKPQKKSLQKRHKKPLKFAKRKIPVRSKLNARFQKAGKVSPEKFQKNEKKAENEPKTPEKVAKSTKQRSDYLSKKLSKISPILSLKTYKSRHFGRQNVMAEKSYFYENFDLDLETAVSPENGMNKNLGVKTTKQFVKIAQNVKENENPMKKDENHLKYEKKLAKKSKKEADKKMPKIAKKSHRISQNALKSYKKEDNRESGKTAKNIEKRGKIDSKEDKIGGKFRPLRKRISPLKWWENQKREESSKISFVGDQNGPDISADLVDNQSLFSEKKNAKNVEIQLKKIAKNNEKLSKSAKSAEKRSKSEKKVEIRSNKPKKVGIQKKSAEKVEIRPKIAKKATLNPKKKRRKSITFESALRKQMAKNVKAAEPQQSEKLAVRKTVSKAKNAEKTVSKNSEIAKNAKKAPKKSRTVKNREIAKKPAGVSRKIKIAHKSPVATNRDFLPKPKPTKDGKIPRKIAEKKIVEEKEERLPLRQRIMRKHDNVFKKISSRKPIKPFLVIFFVFAFSQKTAKLTKRQSRRRAEAPSFRTTLRCTATWTRTAAPAAPCSRTRRPRVRAIRK